MIISEIIDLYKLHTNPKELLWHDKWKSEIITVRTGPRSKINFEYKITGPGVVNVWQGNPTQCNWGLYRGHKYDATVSDYHRIQSALQDFNHKLDYIWIYQVIENEWADGQPSKRNNLLAIEGSLQKPSFVWCAGDYIKMKSAENIDESEVYPYYGSDPYPTFSFIRYSEDYQELLLQPANNNTLWSTTLRVWNYVTTSTKTGGTTERKDKMYAIRTQASNRTKARKLARQEFLANRNTNKYGGFVPGTDDCVMGSTTRISI